MNETYLLADRLEDRERTYFFDQRLTLGVQRDLGRGWSLDLSAAYVFDRQIFQAEKFSGSRRDELTIDPGVAGTFQLLWTRRELASRRVRGLSDRPSELLSARCGIPAGPSRPNWLSRSSR